MVEKILDRGEARMLFMGVTLLIVCMVLRATDILFRTTVIESCSVIFLVGMEHIIATVVMWLLSRIKKTEKLKLTLFQWIGLIFVGCGASVGGIWCFTKAFFYMNPALVILLQKLQPIVVMLLSFIFLREKITRFFILFSILGVVSAYFMSFGFNFEGIHTDMSSTVYGIIYSLLAVVLWGGGTVVGKNLLKDISVFDMTKYRYYIGALFCTVVFLVVLGSSFTDNFIKDDFIALYNSRSSQIFLIYMSLISGGVLSLYLYYLGLKKVSASLSGVIELFYPVSSLILSWAVLGYTFHWYELVFGGLLLVFMSCATLSSRVK